MTPKTKAQIFLFAAKHLQPEDLTKFVWLMDIFEEGDRLSIEELEDKIKSVGTLNES